MDYLFGKFVPESRRPDLKCSLLFSVDVCVNHVVCCEDTVVVECWCFCGRGFCLEGSGADQSPGKYIHKLIVAVCRGVFFSFCHGFIWHFFFFFLSRKHCMCWASVVFKDWHQSQINWHLFNFHLGVSRILLCEFSKWDVKSEHGVLCRMCWFFSHRDQSRRACASLVLWVWLCKLHMYTFHAL